MQFPSRLASHARNWPRAAALRPAASRLRRCNCHCLNWPALICQALDLIFISSAVRTFQLQFCRAAQIPRLPPCSASRRGTAGQHLAGRRGAGSVKKLAEYEYNAASESKDGVRAGSCSCRGGGFADAGGLRARRGARAHCRYEEDARPGAVRDAQAQGAQAGRQERDGHRHARDHVPLLQAGSSRTPREARQDLRRAGLPPPRQGVRHAPCTRRRVPAAGRAVAPLGACGAACALHPTAGPGQTCRERHNAVALEGMAGCKRPHGTPPPLPPPLRPAVCFAAAAAAAATAAGHDHLGRPNFAPRRRRHMACLGIMRAAGRAAAAGGAGTAARAAEARQGIQAAPASTAVSAQLRISRPRRRPFARRAAPCDRWQGPSCAPTR